MSGIPNNSKSFDSSNNAFSPVPNANSFPWKKVDSNNNNSIDISQNLSQNFSQEKLALPKMERNKDTLYSAYDSFLDDKRNTFLSESSFTFDTSNRTSYNESEYEPIVENQMAIVTNEPPKPQQYSMLSALAPLKHVSLDKPSLTLDSNYTEDENDHNISNYQDYSYVSYESELGANEENAILKNQLNNTSEPAKNQNTIDF